MPDACLLKSTWSGRCVSDRLMRHLSLRCEEEDASGQCGGSSATDQSLSGGFWQRRK